MKTWSMRVKLTFIDDLLGTAASNPDIHEKFIASKAPDAATREEEVAAIGADDVVADGRTIFPRNKDGQPIIYGYQVLGFFKSACGFLRRESSTKSSKLKAYKKEIDGNVKVYPDKDNKAGRMIPIEYDGEIGSCQRPLRASTAQGDRVAIADSESINAGASIEFDIVLLNEKLKKNVEEWLEYGEYSGLGQWRNSGKGAFVYEVVSPWQENK